MYYFGGINIYINLIEKGVATFFLYGISGSNLYNMVLFIAPEFVADAPNAKLKLEYIYGYRAIDSRNNL